jgi:hypothetical protein
MRYLVLLYDNEANTNQPGTDAWEAEMAGYMAFGEVAGEAILGGEALHDTSTRRTIRHDGGRVLVTDGPFAESAEVLGGYYVLDVATLDDAIELVRHIPATWTGAAEIRPLEQLMEIDDRPAPEGTDRYVATIHGPETDAETPGTPEWESGAAEHGRFGAKAGDALLGGGAVHPTSTASTVRLRDGELLVTDGPYAEATEVVGGYYVLRGTPESVVELASDIPVPDGGGVELRLIMELGG